MGKFVIVDVESDGPIQGMNSMVCFGAVILDEKLDKTFYGQTKPVSTIYDKDALAISGFSRKEHEKFDDPADVMVKFESWLKSNCGNTIVLLSDNNGYDAAWINWYFHKYLSKNPFGWSSRRIGDLFCGFYNDPYYKWKKHKKTPHTHHPVDDAKGNAEAMLYLINDGFKMKL